MLCLSLLLASSDDVNGANLRRLIDTEDLDDGSELVQYKLTL